MTEPLTPVAIESKLRALVNAITIAQQELRTARLDEDSAHSEYMRAKITAAYSDECPKPKRGETTVGDREMWIDRETMNEGDAARHMTVLREIAVDALRARIAESQAVQSLNASVRQAYSLAGHS